MSQEKKNGSTAVHPNAWINLAILSSVSVLVMYAETMLLPAIPDIIKDFNASYSIQLTISSSTTWSLSTVRDMRVILVSVGVLPTKWFL
jgi:hypothetical protein